MAVVDRQETPTWSGLLAIERHRYVHQVVRWRPLGEEVSIKVSTPTTDARHIQHGPYGGGQRHRRTVGSGLCRRPSVYRGPQTQITVLADKPDVAVLHMVHGAASACNTYVYFYRGY